MLDNSFFSREEVLGGLPARRASTALFAIESRTAFLVGRARQAAARFVSEKSAEARERAFLEALSMGREPPLLPTIQDLERYAPDCVSLMPDDPAVRAAIAQLLGKKYRFTAQAVPALRKLLGLDTDAVRSAFQDQNGRPLESIYAAHLSVREQLRWTWSKFAQRLEDLPPFWTAFSLTFTETVGATVLALPIALAGVGPLVGVVILLVLGLVNLLTIMGIVEAITRNGTIRYGSGYFGRLVADYLGNVGTVALSATFLIMMVLVSIVVYIGVSSTLAASTGIPVTVWAAVLFLIAFWVLRRESLDATVASSLVIGIVSIGLLVVMMLLVLPHIRGENLLYARIPFINQAFDPSILQLVFGIVLSAYFGHTSAANAAKVVLRRDPGGRSLMWGNIAAMGCVTVLYSIWVIVVGGAVAPGVLVSTVGTVIKPLADVAGGGIYLFGTIYVVLSMGITILHCSLGLYNQVREWLPQPAKGINAPPPTMDRLRQLIHLLTTTKRGRFLLGIAPAIVCFAFAEWLILTGQGSFSGLLNLVGIVAVPVVAGIFPMLMLAASRRSGDYIPGLVVRFLGHPVLVGGVYLFYFASLVLHGLFILQEPFQRVVALFISVLIVAISLAILRRGSFESRAVIEVRNDLAMDNRAVFNVVYAGQALAANVTLNQPEGNPPNWASTGELPEFKTLQSIVFELPALAAKKLKVWVHQLTPEGLSESVSALVTADNAQALQIYDLKLSGGLVLLPVDRRNCRIEIRFPEHTPQPLLSDVTDLSTMS
jgi:hypothetical protein